MSRAARLRRFAVCCLIAAAGAVTLQSGTARASVVERVVAVVGEHAILLSDLRARARPFLLRVYKDFPEGASRTAAISQMYRLVLERMVDEELQQRAATRARIAVTAAEVDQAMARIAAQNGITVERLIAEARRTGMGVREYRREVRRQVLDAKMMNLRLQGRIRVTESDLRAHYQGIVLDERRKLPFRAAWIVLDAPRKAPRDRIRRQRALAERVAEQARRGADFAALARRHSKDEATAKSGGLLDRMVYRRLPRAVGRASLALEVGEVSAPVRVGDRFVILKLVERGESKLPTFEEAIEELHERVYLEKMAKARRHWLDSLRRQTHVEIRL